MRDADDGAPPDDGARLDDGSGAHERRADDGDERPASRSTARSSDRVLALLLAIVDRLGEEDGRTLTELADELDLAASTTSRQLSSLEAAQLVARDDNDYVAGPALVRLAHRVVGQHPMPVLAQPLLDRVARATGETCVLAVPHDVDRALYVAAADGTRTLRVTGWLGRDVPREGSAVGRALAGDIQRGATAVGRDTVEEGVTGVSAAVRDTGGEVVAAVSLLGPGFRLRGEPLDRARAAVMDAAADLERLLGG